MGSPGIVVSIVLGAALTISPAAAHALEITLGAVGSSQTFTLSTSTGSALNIDCPRAAGDTDTSTCASNVLGSPRTYNFGLDALGNNIVFTIQRCTGTACGGRARVLVSDGAIDTLVLTDAVIRNASPAGTPPATLTLHIDSGPYTTAGEAGPRAYATELSGSFQPPLPILPANKVKVSALACFAEPGEGEGDFFINCSGGPEGRPRLIDNPACDPGESGEGCDTFKYSLIAPPFKPAGTSQYGPKEEDIKFCPDYGGETCNPALRLLAEVSLAPGYSVRAPGSIGTAGSKDICDPSSTDPERQKGCVAMAEYFAKLGPKGAQMYDVRLEPSPGGSNLFVRSELNTFDAWTADRTGQGAQNLGASKLKASLETNGSGELKVHGLCNVLNGCCPVSLPVRVYCADFRASNAVLNTDHHGNGSVDLVTPSPCLDPAVLIMDESNSFWVAAPLVQ